MLTKELRATIILVDILNETFIIISDKFREFKRIKLFEEYYKMKSAGTQTRTFLQTEKPNKSDLISLLLYYAEII